MPITSASSAVVPGTSSPSLARCRMVREVLKPSAPARSPSRTSAAISAISAGVAFSFFAPRSPIT